VPDAEQKGDTERLGDLLATVDKGHDGFGHDKGQVVLESLPQPAPLMIASIRSGADVDPDVAVAYFDWIAAYVICPGVESAAATQVETSVVPVAREDLAADASTI